MICLRMRGGKEADVICGGQHNFVQLVLYFLLYMDTEDQTQVAGLEQQVPLSAEPSCLF